MLTAKNTLQYEIHPRIQTEAQEHGMDVEVRAEGFFFE